MKHIRHIGICCLCVILLAAMGTRAAARAREAQEVTQYGITWEFDKPHPVGTFVTGDYWVVGPVTIVRVTPSPGPAFRGTTTTTAKTRYGASINLIADDRRMRNGSMIVFRPDENQGYDSRLENYQPQLSVKFPRTLGPRQSLISTISNNILPAPTFFGTLGTSYGNAGKGSLVLKTAAVLTCLDKIPPADAFRPPYAGTERPLYETKAIRWELLPKLAPVRPVPRWEAFERIFQRPWLDHIDNWMVQFTGPSENQECYGREIARANSIGILMLMLDVPRERRQKLMIGMLQLGIDLHGLAKCGRQWSADGGHWNGRKWPILFAGLMLGDKDMQTLPGTTLFSEDQQTYYGKGWFGDRALWQMVFHTGPARPHEEKSPDTWDKSDRFNEGYRGVVSAGLVGTALAVQLMKARALWNHDAFFDYLDRWMSRPDFLGARRKAIADTYPRWGKSMDPFVDAMWAAYRQRVPAQPGGSVNLKWVWGDSRSSRPDAALAWSRRVWKDGPTGYFVPDPQRRGVPTSTAYR
jgi:hypothetical protein